MPNRRDLANAIRALSMDAVEAAKSGHPGAPMGMADIAEVLWNDFLRHNPANPRWADRDRFVLSNGHGSMLLVFAAAPERLRPADRGAQAPSASCTRRPPATRKSA
jgi:transketolase